LNTESTAGPVLVVDFGAQYAQLIARRVREAHVFSEIIGHNLTAAEIAAKNPAGIIFSGGPASVHVDGAPSIDQGVSPVIWVARFLVPIAVNTHAPNSLSWLTMCCSVPHSPAHNRSG